jgi:hypothetical protein
MRGAGGLVYSGCSERRVQGTGQRVHYDRVKRCPSLTFELVRTAWRGEGWRELSGKIMKE